MSEDRAVTTNFSEHDQPEGAAQLQLLDDSYSCCATIFVYS